MATTVSEADVILDAISEQIHANRRRVEQAKNQLSTAQADLKSMTSLYASFVSDLNALAAANPGNATMQSQKGLKDNLVTDFQDLKTQVEAMLTALGIAFTP